NRRTRGAGCPFCAGSRVSVTNGLATVAPALASEWHPTKNGALRPSDVVGGSRRRVWWRCPGGRDHVWQTTLAKRYRGQGCPFCSGRRVSSATSLAVRAPEIAREWHPTKNGALRPTDVTRGTRRRVWWKCPEGDDHEWAVAICVRTGAKGFCPFCI